MPIKVRGSSNYASPCISKRKQQIERPHCKTLDWMMNRGNRYSYQNLKEMSRCRRTWRDWCL